VGKGRQQAKHPDFGNYRAFGALLATFSCKNGADFEVMGVFVISRPVVCPAQFPGREVFCGLPKSCRISTALIVKTLKRAGL